MASPELMTGLGAALSIFLASAGACVASAPAGIFALRAQGIHAFGPIVIAGVLAIYGCIISVILTSKFQQDGLTEKEGYKFLSAGLAVGLSCLASGMGMARFLEAYMMSSFTKPSTVSLATAAEEPLIGGARAAIPVFSLRVFLVFVFIEAIALYGLIIALLLAAQ